MTVSVPRAQNRRGPSFLENGRIWLLVIITIVLVGAIYMGQVSQAAVIGQRVQDKQERISRLIKENAQLEADIASLLAPDRIDSRAKALGLRIAKPEQIKYLVVKDYPIEPTRTPASSAPSRVDPATPVESSGWWLDLLRLLPGFGPR